MAKFGQIDKSQPEKLATRANSGRFSGQILPRKIIGHGTVANICSVQTPLARWRGQDLATGKLSKATWVANFATGKFNPIQSVAN